MLTKITSSLAVAALAAGVLGLTTLNVSAAANTGGGGLNEAGTCTYGGVTYSEGAKVYHPDGTTQTCRHDGTWSAFMHQPGSNKIGKVPGATNKAN